MPKPKDRWYQVRLRTVLFAVTLIAIALGVWSAFLRPYLVQAELRVSISDAGGTLELRPGPQWLRFLLKDNYRQHITLINLADTDPDEAILAQIGELPELEILILGGLSITDDTLRYLPNCESLQAVILDSTLVTDETIANLQAARPGLHVNRCDRRALLEIEKLGLTEHGLQIFCTPPEAIAQRVPEAYFQEARSVAVKPGIVRIRNPKLAALSERAHRTLLFSFECMHQLQGLSVAGTAGVTADDLVLLEKCFRLEQLEVEKMSEPIAEDILSWIAHLNDLTDLSFAYSPVTDKDLVALGDLKKLRSLDLTGTSVTDPASWPEFPLEKLSLEDCYIEDDDMPAIARFGKLRELNLSHTELTPRGLRELLPLAELNQLQLIGTRITYETYDILCQFSRLQSLAIGVFAKKGIIFKGWSVPESALADPAKWPNEDENVFEFKPETMRPDAEVIAKIREAFRQRIADVAATQDGSISLGDDEWYHLDLLENQAGITTVDLGNSLACDDDLKYIASMPDLKYLYLNDTWVSDTGLQTLVGCKKLEALNLVGTRVTDQGMKAVSQITTLKSITLPTQTVRGAGMKELQQLPQLKFLTCWPTRNHWIYFARKRLAPDWNADDVSQLAELAAILLPRLDTNGDGRVEMPDLEVTIGPEWRIKAYTPFAIGGIQDAIDGNEVTQTSLINSVLLYQDVAEDANRDDREIRTGKATHFNWW